MNALSHLSPDVLEVVRDVARQEDSFLLRVREVPLNTLVGRRAPSLSARALFLSAAERHLLEYHRHDLASGFEAVLYDLVSKGPGVERAVVSDALWSAEERAQRVGRANDAKLATPLVYRDGSVHTLLDSNRKFEFDDWASVARTALLLRAERSTQANVVFGHLGQGDVLAADSVAVAVHAAGFRDHAFLATRGMIEYARGRFESAASFYTLAWDVLPAPRYLVPAAANHLIAHGTCPRMLARALSELGDRLSFHAHELQQSSRAPIHETARPNAVARLQAVAKSRLTNEVEALWEALL